MIVEGQASDVSPSVRFGSACLTTQEAAEFLKVSPSHLTKLRLPRNQGKGPRARRLGVKVVRYALDDLVAWTERRVTT